MKNDTRIITLAEWTATNAQKPATTSKWARDRYLPGAYRSPDQPGGTWLLPANTPVPAFRPAGTAGRRLKAERTA